MNIRLHISAHMFRTCSFTELNCFPRISSPCDSIIASVNSSLVIVDSSNSHNAMQDASLISNQVLFLMPSSNLATQSELSSNVFIFHLYASVCSLSIDHRNQAATEPIEVG